MLDLALAGFLAFFLLLGFKRPFLWVLCYLYVDILAPQIISLRVLALLPVSQIVFLAAFGGWILLDRKENSRFTWRQGLMIALLLYCGYTTLTATYAVEAAEKWSWVWKAMLFAIFLPLTLHSRLRIESVVLVMVLTASALIIDGGLKTVLGGGGYDSLRFFVENNTGLYEGSIISCVAIAIIPLTLWLAKHGTIFPPEWRVWTFAAALIFACALIPVGTQARTGLICLALLCALYLRTAKHRFLISMGMSAAMLLAVPFLPQSFTARMNTIENHKGDQSANTRLAVWGWTLGYVKDHPLGGGFEIYIGNTLRFETVNTQTAGSTTLVETTVVEDSGRAFHSSYFEMLGEQGIPGFLMWMVLQGSGLWQMEMIRRRYRKRTEPDAQWQGPLAVALQQAHLVYLAGSLFVGIAFQPFILMLISLQCGFWSYLKRIEAPAKGKAARTAVRREMRVRGDSEDAASHGAGPHPA